MKKPNNSLRSTRKQAPPSRRRLQTTYEGPASARTAMRTGIPRIRTAANGTIVVENQEIAMPIIATATAGSIPSAGYIKIMRFENTQTGNSLNLSNWVTKLALAYDKWVIEDLKLWFVPSVAFTTSGMNAMYFDSDPSRSTPPSTVAAVSGDMRATSKQVYTEMSLQVLRSQMNRLPQYECFPIAGDLGIATVGSINFVHDPILLANSSASGPTPIGNVWMKYTIRLLNPSNSIA
uniref:Capsid protein n=1 Tax=Jitepeofons virus TaxID=3072209 RepID=A0AA96NKX3_9VIRU|nr:MAG: coat protein [Jitepeofons virus]